MTVPLRASGVFVEGRYECSGLYVAGRLDRLSFSDLDTATGVTPWEAPVTRVEIGAGYYVRRNLLAKGVFQHNSREGGFVQHLGVLAGQLQFWL